MVGVGRRTTYYSIDWILLINDLKHPTSMYINDEVDRSNWRELFIKSLQTSLSWPPQLPAPGNWEIPRCPWWGKRTHA